MAKKKPYRIEGREQGRGPKWVDKFDTLLEAQTYVRERWQGAEYRDGDSAFHTDYATFKLDGFKLSDIGDLRADQDDDGTFYGFVFDFKDLEGF